MKIAIIDKKDATIKVENKTLKVNDQNLPFRLIDTLIIASNHHIQTKDIIKITNEDISIILLSYNQRDASLITSAKGKNAELKLSQYKAIDKSLTIAKFFITKKFIYHANHLKSHKIDTDITKLLKNVEQAKDLQTLLGIEGSFSKWYFTNFFNLFPKALHSGKRTKNPPKDPLNATLSFCYMLFYSIITIKLISYGFEPTIGYLHKPFRSHNALSSDLMETIRADINEFVYELFSKTIIKKGDFTKKDGVFLRYEGRKKLWKEIKRFIQVTEPKLELIISEFRSLL